MLELMATVSSTWQGFNAFPIWDFNQKMITWWVLMTPKKIFYNKTLKFIYFNYDRDYNKWVI